MLMIELPFDGHTIVVNLAHVTQIERLQPSDNGNPLTEICLAVDGRAIEDYERRVLVEIEYADLILFIRETSAGIADFSLWQRKRAAREQGAAV